MKTHLFLGTDLLTNFLKKYDIKVENNASLALGTLNTNIYNLANMYTNIASGGSYQKLYTIERIEDHEGNLIYQHKDKPKQTLDKDTCYILSKLLTGTFNSQFSTYLSATMANYDLDYDVACKTGSTDYDNLVVAYTPDILISGWVGYDDNAKIINSKEKVIAKTITCNILKQQKKTSWYQPTDRISEIRINPLTGDRDNNGIVYWFKKP